MNDETHMTDNPPSEERKRKREEEDVAEKPRDEIDAVNNPVNICMNENVTVKDEMQTPRNEPDTPAKKVKTELSDTKPAQTPATTVKKKPKRLLRTEDDFEPVNRWWEKQKVKGDDSHWYYLEHRGTMFTPPYVAHGIKIYYEGQSVSLPPDAEEAANFWCSVIATEKEEIQTFRDNFWEAFVDKLPKSHIIRKGNSLDACDFSPIKQYFDELKQKKTELTKEEKEALKEQNREYDRPYTHAIVDGLKEKLGNFKVEPPQLFRGRGVHPKQGQLKARIYPEDVTINCSEDAPVPKCQDMHGHCWKDVYHDNTVTWLGYYRDSIKNSFKYVFLSPASGLKGKKDFMKYEKARMLKNYIEHVRGDYLRKMKSNDVTERQLGTATYFIDFLALRVGNEKKKDVEADTVGCCSLRVEHISLNRETSEVTLDFLGKDSIRYHNVIKINQEAFKNLEMFLKKKKPSDLIFDRISTTGLNKYLKDLMPDLSAKVFRTFNASLTLQQELDKSSGITDPSDANSVAAFYDAANRAVAILCNHQRSVPKTHSASMEKMQEQITELEEAMTSANAYLAAVKSGKSYKIKTKKESNGDLSQEEKKPRDIFKENMSEMQLLKKIEQLKIKKTKLEHKAKLKDSNKEVALNTSKINYMDPRITVSFCKKFELPVEKVFGKSLRDKFPWAMYARSDYVF